MNEASRANCVTAKDTKIIINQSLEYVIGLETPHCLLISIRSDLCAPEIRLHIFQPDL